MMRWYPEFSPSRIKGVDVFLERSQTRQHVGVLDMSGQKFRFVYDDAYLKARSVLPLGPELPLTCKEFVADKLFPSLVDRLPDPDNPAYSDYCTAAGIAVTTTDPIVLLATIGKRGPSSFVFEPIYKNEFTFDMCEKWREQLGLSMQDFANLFDVSPSILQKIKAGTSSGKDVLQQLELYWRVPEALDYQIQKQGKWLNGEKREEVIMLTNKEQDFWNIFGFEEKQYTQECLGRLQGISWAKGLVSELNKKGINQGSRTKMFEARFANALWRSGLVCVENEHKAGIGNSDVDFMISMDNGKRWLVELTSAQESDAMKSATQPNDFGGYLYRSDFKKDGHKCNVEISQLIKMRNIIFGKVANEKNEPIKFPVPQFGDYHVIVVDMRGFGYGYDEKDWKDVCYGHPQIEEVIEHYKFQWENNKNSYAKHHLDISKHTRGVFSTHNTDPCAQHVRERIHVIGFICERHYAEGEIETMLQLFHNPNLITREELDRIWPLKKHESYNPDSNPNRYRPPLPPEFER